MLERNGRIPIIESSHATEWNGTEVADGTADVVFLQSGDAVLQGNKGAIRMLMIAAELQERAGDEKGVILDFIEI